MAGTPMGCEVYRARDCAGRYYDAKVRIMDEKNRTKCEVYSRVVGYLRPVDQWNVGKQTEFDERKEFDVVRL
jgi:ribonucleoside-triphosphate reductase